MEPVVPRPLPNILIFLVPVKPSISLQHYANCEIIRFFFFQEGISLSLSLLYECRTISDIFHVNIIKLMIINVIYFEVVSNTNTEDDAASTISSEAGREAEPEGEETETAPEGEGDDEDSVTRCIW